MPNQPILPALICALTLLGACKPDAPSQPAAPTRGPTASATTAEGLHVKEIAVTAKGYEPQRIDVEGGKPVVLRFTRTTTDTCGEAVIVAGDPVAHMLPVNRPVDVKVTPPKSGELAFACGMGMMHGMLVVR